MTKLVNMAEVVPAKHPHTVSALFQSITVPNHKLTEPLEW